MATYVNDLRLKEIATGDEAGTWGTSTNTNLELIAEAMGHGAEAVANASTHTITMADGATDQFRSTFLRLTGGGQACTVTLAPNTLSHTWIMRNETAAALTLTQGSGANVAIAAGQTKIVATDGAGSGAVVYEMDDLELAGNLLVGGTLGVTGVLTANAGVVVDNITIDGTEIDLSSGDLTIDVAGDIILDADGGDVNFKDGGTEYLRVTNGASGPEIFSTSNDGDLFLKGVDGGATITALTLDMSAAGAATFNSSVDAGAGLRFSTDGSNNGVIQTLGQDKDMFFSGDDGGSGINALILDMSAAGAATFNSTLITGNMTISGQEIDVSQNDLTLDVAGNIFLNADGSLVVFADGAVEYGRVGNSSSDFAIQSLVQDKDIAFKGNDNGTIITALTLDMSASGAATFNSTISMGNLLNITDGTTTGFLSTTSGLMQFGLSTNHSLVFYTNNTERMRIGPTGDLLVGTTASIGTSVAKLEVLGGSGGGRCINTKTAITTSANAITFNNGNGQVGSITTNGSATAYNQSSDYRLKENVVAMSGATERLKQLNPSRFNFIADADTTVDGFLAHEVQDVVPEAITGTKDAVDADGNPDYQGIDQSKLVPLLVATIQELEARLTALENN